MPADRFAFLAPADETADWRLVVLLAAADDAGLLGALPGSTDDLAARAGLDPVAARVVLDALARWDVVGVSGGGRWDWAPAAPSDEERLAVHQLARSIRRSSAVLGDRLRGLPATPEPRGDVDLARWQGAMAASARQTAPALVDACLARAPAARRVLDLGGGHGEYSLEFARRGLSATMQDRPEVIALAERQGGLPAAGVELFAGDFFEILPGGPFDVVLCAGITHTFSGEFNRLLYRRLRPLVPAGGGVGVFTFLRGRPADTAFFAVQMLTVGTGGDTHAVEDYRAWLGGAGFGCEVVPFEGQLQSLLWAAPVT